MSEIWLTSDEHYFHNNVIDMCDRPYNDVREMTEAFIQNHNAVVGKGDRTYHLGDFSFGKKEETQEVLSQLNGQHYHICGNHDDKQISELNWVWSRQKSGLKVNKKSYIHMDHYPHMSWNRSYHGSYQAFGHVHSKGGDFWQYQNTCDVGVDYWRYRPVNVTEFIEHLDRVKEYAFEKGFSSPFFWRGRGMFSQNYKFFGFPQDEVI